MRRIEGLNENTHHERIFLKTTMTDAHKAIVKHFYEGLWNKADKSAIPELLHEQVSFRGSLGVVQRGHKGFALYMASSFTRSPIITAKSPTSGCWATLTA